jgi:cytochrome c-type biogenesis protein CcmH/NrfG
MRFAFLLVLFLAGCATPPSQPPAPQEAPPPKAVPVPPQAETTAVASLMESARAETAAGRLANAAASLERALRIEPRNPRLWHELAQVRLRQRDYAQAESLATRSNSLAGNNSELRAANQRLIEEARSR